MHDETGLISDQTKIFLRDCYDHSVQIMELVEGYRDATAGLMELYLSAVSIRTNETMRVLTGHVLDLHSAHLHRRCLRHELRFRARDKSR
jgi:hypothetical protein